MEPEQGTSAVRKILGGKGAKLHTHAMHLRRTANKGYIAKHEMRDSKGQPPKDGQDPEREYSLANKAQMLAHVEQHMGDQPQQDDDDEQQSGGAQQPQPGGAPPAAAGPVQ